MRPAKDPNISLETFKKFHSYDPETGAFTRLACFGRDNTSVIGERSDWINAYGYRAIRLPNRSVAAHRAAYFYMTGEWPVFVDHINRDTYDNRWCNLRHCTHQQNSMNRTRSDNTTGVKGVTARMGAGGKTRYVARVTLDGYRKHVQFYSLEEAKEYVEKTRSELHGDFANHG